MLKLNLFAIIEVFFISLWEFKFDLASENNQYLTIILV